MMMIRARWYVFLIYISTVTSIEGDYFYGGTLTYKVSKVSESIISVVIARTYLYNYSEVYCNDEMIAKQSPILVYNSSLDTVNCTQHCSEVDESESVPIPTFCTDYSKAFDITVGRRLDFINTTDDSSFQIVLSNRSWRRLSLPQNLTDSILWNVSCSITLRKRSNGEYNHPPVSSMISPIRIPEDILQTIFIPTIDTDNDEIRCRFASEIDACEDVCYPSSLPNGTNLLPNCTLLVTGESADDWYRVTIMVEDFVDSSSTQPLSGIPVQFLINVHNKSICRAPHLTGSTTESNRCIGILIGESFQIELKAESFCSDTTTIQDIATLSFYNVAKTSIVQNTTSTWSVSLTWTPTVEQIGSQILCAVTIDSNNFQSNQYCITFIVAKESIPLCSGRTDTSTTEFVTIDSTMISTTLDSTTSGLLTSSLDDQTETENSISHIIQLQQTTTVVMISSASAIQSTASTTSHSTQLFNTSISTESTTISYDKFSTGNFYDTPETTTSPNIHSKATANSDTLTTVFESKLSTATTYTETVTAILGNELSTETTYGQTLTAVLESETSTATSNDGTLTTVIENEFSTTIFNKKISTRIVPNERHPTVFFDETIPTAFSNEMFPPTISKEILPTTIFRRKSSTTISKTGLSAMVSKGRPPTPVPVKSLRTSPDDVSITNSYGNLSVEITDKNLSRVVLSLLSSTDITDFLQLSSKSSLNDDNTNPIVVLSPSGSLSPWYWAGPLVGILGVCLIGFSIWCYCSYPVCCCKNHKKRPITKSMNQRKKTSHPPKSAYKVYKVAEKKIDSNIKNTDIGRSWKVKHNHTSKITPTSLSEQYIFGQYHHSKVNTN